MRWALSVFAWYKLDLPSNMAFPSTQAGKNAVTVKYPG
jgi:hypothetical protein